MKDKKKEKADIYSQLAGTMDFFINDMLQEREFSGDKNLYAEYLKEARRIKEGFSNMSEKNIEN